MANLCTEATNLLKFCMTCSDGLDLTLRAGAGGFEFAAGGGYMYTGSAEGATGSGLFWGWSVDFLGSSPGSFPLLSSLNKGRISSSFFHGPYITLNCGASCSSSGSSVGSTFNSS